MATTVTPAHLTLENVGEIDVVRNPIEKGVYLNELEQTSSSAVSQDARCVIEYFDLADLSRHL